VQRLIEKLFHKTALLKVYTQQSIYSSHLTASDDLSKEAEKVTFIQSDSAVASLISAARSRDSGPSRVSHHTSLLSFIESFLRQLDNSVQGPSSHILIEATSDTLKRCQLASSWFPYNSLFYSQPRSQLICY